jgi:hypothetical protein
MQMGMLGSGSGNNQLNAGNPETKEADVLDQVLLNEGNEKKN